MATRWLLADLSDALRRHCSLTVHFDSAGGIEVAKRIRAGAQADLAVLSSRDMSDLDATGLLQDGTLRPLYVSDVVAAVPDRGTSVAFATEEDLKAALGRAGRIAYSTGPSGQGLMDLIQRWGLGQAVEHKMVRVAPGTPVGNLLADDKADLGFQQRSELSDVTGIRVLGPLPGAAAIRSTFSGAVLATSMNKASARRVLSFLESEQAEPYVLAAGMTIAST